MEATAVSTTPTAAPASTGAPKAAWFAGISIILVLTVSFLMSFLYCYGAAKLAMSLPGNGFLMGFFAYTFAGLYYPYFALFKHNQCPTSNVTTSGGARRK